MTSVAKFDILKIVYSLEEPFNGASKVDIHTISYLSALMYVYSGEQYNEWGYEYIYDIKGGPFSNEIDDNLSNLISGGLIEEKGHLYYLTNIGNNFLENIQNQKRFSSRVPAIEASISAALGSKTELFRKAIRNEPSIKSERTISDKGGVLIKGPARELLHEQFRLIKTVVSNHYKDLAIPAFLWLKMMESQPA